MPSDVLRTQHSDIAVINKLIEPGGNDMAVLHLIAEQLIAEVKREISEVGILSDDLLSALHSVFRQHLIHAFDLVDRNSVTHFTCPSGRELYRVKGSSSRTYTCFSSSSYCDCPSFVYAVLIKEDSLVCKHTLATQLAVAMNRCRELGVSDVEFAELLSGGGARFEEA